MIRNRYFQFIFCIGFLAVIASCADKVDVDLSENENATFTAWMAKNRPDMPEVRPGLYYQIHRAANGDESTRPSYNSWVEITFDGKNLDGDYFVNMYGRRAKYLGTFTYFTHYAPLVVQLYPENPRFVMGQYLALHEMNVGDSVEMYMSSEYAYGSGGSTANTVDGFRGNIVLGGYTPAHITMKLNASTRDIEETRLEQVMEYAENVLGIPRADSIKEGFYLKITQENPEGDIIGEDSIAYVYYVGKFLDGFIFATNDEPVARANHIFVSDRTDELGTSESWYDALQFEATSLTTTTVEGFREAVMNMRTGEKGIAVFTSDWGYGASGDTSDSTVIQPYDPLVYELEVYKTRPERKR